MTRWTSDGIRTCTGRRLDLGHLSARERAAIAEADEWVHGYRRRLRERLAKQRFRFRPFWRGR